MSHAGSVRFRPIVLTSITTFVGLVPIMMDNTISTSMFTPMAVSLAFGVLFGTVITLFLVPCLYLVLEDFEDSWAAEPNDSPGLTRACRSQADFHIGKINQPVSFN